MLESVNALMTSDKQVNDRFIRDASLSLAPVEPLFDCRSLPAKSIRCNWPTRTVPEPTLTSSFKLFCFRPSPLVDLGTLFLFNSTGLAELFSTVSMVREKIECDLLECSFILVAAVARFLSPSRFNRSSSSKLLTR